MRAEVDDARSTAAANAVKSAPDVLAPAVAAAVFARTATPAAPTPTRSGGSAARSETRRGGESGCWSRGGVRRLVRRRGWGRALDAIGGQRHRAAFRGIPSGRRRLRSGRGNQTGRSVRTRQSDGSIRPADPVGADPNRTMSDTIPRNERISFFSDNPNSRPKYSTAHWSARGIFFLSSIARISNWSRISSSLSAQSTAPTVMSARVRFPRQNRRRKNSSARLRRQCAARSLPPVEK